ncbi:MAG: CoA pyrophosphatase [Acidobacteria bacterium]|nr:MAG: CoA pyrophosphatase [Acidobacteriota bacterium]
MTDAPPTSWISELRQRLQAPPPRRLPPADDRPAAVLVPLYVDAGELWTLLTRRSHDLPHHQGQIAFPGGGLKAGEEAWDGALREAQEEIGLDPKRVLRLGRLDEVATASSGYRITPCVGAVPYPIDTRLDPGEIDELFAVPVNALANPTVIEERPVTIDGRRHLMRVYHVGGRQVWGLTARIVQNLLARLGLETAPEIN